MARFEHDLNAYFERDSIWSNKFFEVYYDLELFIKDNTQFVSLSLQFFSEPFERLINLLIFIFMVFFIFKLIAIFRHPIRKLKNYIRENFFNHCYWI